MQIGELARRAGVNPKTLRYYESVGLLPEPARSAAGYRLYGEADERRLGFIVAARSAGFSLGEISEILALRDRGVAPCGYVAGRIEAKRHELDRQLRDLERLRTELDDLARLALNAPQGPAATAGYCHILEGRSGKVETRPAGKHDGPAVAVEEREGHLRGTLRPSDSHT